MKTAIVFSSTHGTAEKASQLLKENLGGDVEIIDLGRHPKQNIEEFDTVIIGGSIHAGTIQPKVKQFIERNKNVLSAKKIGLFLCCMFEGEVAQKQFETAYPDDLRNASVANGLFGGEFIFNKMNFLEKLIVKRASGVKSDVSNIDVNAIKKFAHDFKSAFK
ncbi:MAG: flavodoxin domain-containing protein [Bacillota bacterium]